MTLNRLFRGEHIRLTALNPDDVPTVTGWYEDSDFLRLLDAAPAYPRVRSAMEDWIEDGSKRKNAFLFAIRLLDTDQLLGFVELDDILWTHGVAWVAIGIGSPAHRSKGYGCEAMSLVLDFAFSELNLHRVQLTVFSYNDHAIRLYEKLGFQAEGIYRECLHRDGQRHDMILYGLLRPEWEAQHPGTAPPDSE